MYGHIYTKEQDEFIRRNYSNIGICTSKFNEHFKTNLSYSAIKNHAGKKLKLTTGFRPWTAEMNAVLASALSKHSYVQTTKILNAHFNTNFSQKQIQDHCVRCGIKRNHKALMQRIDKIIAENIDKNYGDIRKIILESTGKKYSDDTPVCVRATHLGLSRPHRVWQNADDNRTVNGEKVTFSEYMRFIGNRWHRIAPELQSLALQVVKLQSEAAKHEANL